MTSRHRPGVFLRLQYHRSMSDIRIDLGSDTLTRPTPEMRAAMAAAPVGDDVFGEDPTIARLEAEIAKKTGKEAALFVPSGTMSNQIALRLHCHPGDEFLCEANCHIFNYEQAAFAQFFGISAMPVPGAGGILTPADLAGRVRPENDHYVRTRLLCLENTHNRGAGRIHPHAEMLAVCRWARQEGLALHLDGARLFNAVVASGIPAAEWAQPFDTVSVCFSKGLGAPVGSALCGSAELISQARRHRKALGGGMRQAGIIAAGALYAVEHHIERLSEDHQHAQLIAAAVAQAPGLTLDPSQIDTNILVISVAPELGTAAEFAGHLQAKGVRVFAIAATQIRVVTHLNVTTAQAEEAAELIALTALDLTNQHGSSAAPGQAYA